MDTDCLAYLNKATESLAGAESEFANRRYNNCANRCYYAMFQTAIAALMAADVRPANIKEEWGHDFAQAQFSGLLIKRRKLYPAELASLLPQSLDTREIADYDTEFISHKVAERGLQKAKVFIAVVTRSLL